MYVCALLPLSLLPSLCALLPLLLFTPTHLLLLIFSTLLPPSPQANSSLRVRCCVLRPSWNIFNPTLPLQPARQAFPLQPSWHFLVQAERGERRTFHWWSGGMQPSYPTGGEALKICLVSSPDPAHSLTSCTKSNFLASTHFCNYCNQETFKAILIQKCLDTQRLCCCKEGAM